MTDSSSVASTVGTVGTVGTVAYVAVTATVTVLAAVRGIWSPCGLSMISAINPFTERSRGNRYWLTALWFIAGAVLGGALLGGLAAIGALLWGSLAAALQVPVAVTVGIATVGCLVAVASDSAAFGISLPGHPRQVNEQWLGRYRRWVYACGFGVQIGMGFATYIMTAAVYLTVLLGALSGSPAMALAVGLLFGLVRGLAVLLSSRTRDPAALRSLHRRLDLLGPWSLRAVIAVQAVAAGILGYAAAGTTGLAVAVVAVAALLVLGRHRARRLQRATVPPTSRTAPDVVAA